MSSENLMKSLSRAIELKNTEKVHELLKKNPEILKNPDNKETASKLLKEAIIKKDENTFELLVKSGADVNLGNTLELAVLKGNVKFVKLLLDNGSKLDESPVGIVFDRSNKIGGNRKEILKLLLAYFPDSGFRDKFGKNLMRSFIDNFVHKDHDDASDLAEILLNAGVPINGTDSVKDTPLLHAIEPKHENLHFIKCLIKRGADVNKKNEDSGDFPLLLAVYCENLNIVDLLLSNGADVNAKNHSGWTALHEACASHNENIIRLLMRKGADVNAANVFGKVPFSLLDPKGKNYNDLQRIFDKTIKL